MKNCFSSNKKTISHKYLIKKGLSNGQIRWAIKKGSLIIVNEGVIIEERYYDANSPYLIKFKELFAANVMTMETLKTYGVTLEKMQNEVHKRNLEMDFISGRYVFNVCNSPFIKKLIKRSKEKKQINK